VRHYIPLLSSPYAHLTFSSVNVFYRINQEKSDSSDPETAKQEKEFKIGSMGFSDSSGIMLAALVSMPLELSLCAAQVKRGKGLCRSL
jgi:battenin